MSSLYAIQMDQEDPFDAAGVDDLNMHVLDEPPFYMWEPRKDKTGGHYSQKSPDRMGPPQAGKVPMTGHGSFHPPTSLRGSHPRKPESKENLPPPRVHVYPPSTTGTDSSSTIPHAADVEDHIPIDSIGE